MISALTMSIIGCIYLFSKHRQSLDQIKKMMVEFDKLSTDEHQIAPSRSSFINNLKDQHSIYNNNSGEQSDDSGENSSLRRYSSSLFNFRRKKSTSLNQSNQKQNNDYLTQNNMKLSKELDLAKLEAEKLRKARENADGQLMQLRLAEQELENVRLALKQSEARLEMVKYQPPLNLILLLHRTYESEKELLDFKLKLIYKEKENCMDTLNKVSRRQSGILGALKIAHSSTLEELNHKLENLK